MQTSTSVKASPIGAPHWGAVVFCTSTCHLDHTCTHAHAQTSTTSSLYVFISFPPSVTRRPVKPADHANLDLTATFWVTLTWHKLCFFFHAWYNKLPSWRHKSNRFKLGKCIGGFPTALRVGLDYFQFAIKGFRYLSKNEEILLFVTSAQDG